MRTLREIRLMRHFHHENITTVMDLFPPPASAPNDVYIVESLMETDLHSIIYSHQTVDDDHIQYFIYQILLALRVLHSANVFHRDLKPANVLVNSDCSIKICDFGLARSFSLGMSDLTEYVITRWYRAPEVMLSCQEYGQGVDIWSTGCILAELIGSKPLWPGTDYRDQLTRIFSIIGSPSPEDMIYVRSPRARAFVEMQIGKPRMPFNELFPRANPLAIDLLSKMLEFNPIKRISVDDALQHPYFDAIREDADLEAAVSTPFLDSSFEATKNLSVEEIKDLLNRDIQYFKMRNRPTG
jgi:serine/threonine protein kinase